MSRFRIKIAAVFYGFLSLGACLWVMARDNGIHEILYHPDGVMTNDPVVVDLLISGAAGVAFGLGIARLSRYLVHRFSWAQGLHIEFRGLLGPLNTMDILLFSSFSAIGEELLFRGALQTSLGIVPSSLIFGLLHVGPSRKFIPWPFQAVLMGFAFGALFWLTGNLAAPVMAHFAINYQNLHFINRYDPSLQLPRVLRENPPLSK